MLSQFSIEISQFVEIFEPEVLKKSRLCRDYVEKSRKFSINLDLSRRSRFVSTISICLDDLDKYLDEDKSRPKNLDQEKKKVDLDRRENLDGFQKLVSTLRTFSISISICLDVETPKLSNEHPVKNRFIQK